MDPAGLPEPRAVGTSRSGREQSPWLSAGFAPAGAGVWSTTRDLARLARGVLDGDAPGASAIETRRDFTDGDRIGLGWITSDVNGRTITWHNGGTGGFLLTGMGKAAIGLAIGRALVPWHFVPPALWGAAAAITAWAAITAVRAWPQLPTVVGRRPRLRRVTSGLALGLGAALVAILI